MKNRERKNLNMNALRLSCIPRTWQLVLRGHYMQDMVYIAAHENHCYNILSTHLVVGRIRLVMSYELRPSLLHELWPHCKCAQCNFPTARRQFTTAPWTRPLCLNLTDSAKIRCIRAVSALSAPSFGLGRFETTLTFNFIIEELRAINW